MFPIIATLDELLIYSGRTDYLLATGSPTISEILQQEANKQHENNSPD